VFREVGEIIKIVWLVSFFVFLGYTAWLLLGGISPTGIETFSDRITRLTLGATVYLVWNFILTIVYKTWEFLEG